MSNEYSKTYWFFKQPSFPYLIKTDTLKQIDDIEGVPNILGIATSKSLAKQLYIDPNNFGQVFHTWVQMINAFKKKDEKENAKIWQTKLSA